jgi:ribosomal protein S18 acetylase RimI-like enzyme
MEMADIRLVDVRDEETFMLLPPCADPRFDHRTCDYWEDADRGSKAARAAWLHPPAPAASVAPAPAATNPFLADLQAAGPPPANPFAARRPNPFVAPDEDDAGEIADNPFAPATRARPGVAADAPRKLQLLGRGLGVAGTYAKVLLEDGEPAAYAQFGPLTAYPRAQRTRDLYPALPDSPLPAVITCIATTAQARHRGLARRLVSAVCEDLGRRGFSAVEAYPAVGADPDETSAADPAFWESVGFARTIDDARFPVMRRELL